MSELKDITEVLSEVQDTECTEEVVAQCDRCETCKNWIKLHMAPTAMRHSGCKWLKDNHYILAANAGGLNAPFLIPEDFIPRVFEKCKGYIKKD